MKLKKWSFFAAALLAAAFAGCGYKMAGGGYINEDISRIAVEVFENNSSEARAGMSFTKELVREILERTDTVVVDAGTAARTITGTVKAITFSALSRTSTETVYERQVTAVVDVKLLDTGGRIVWSVKGLSARESYQTASNVADDEANKRRAVDLIAQRISERLVNRMMSNF